MLHGAHVQNDPLRDANLETLRARAHAYLSGAQRAVGTRELAHELFRGCHRSSGLSSVLIRTLLGRDDRFRELESGSWRIVEPFELGTRLAECSFAVVDLEATGSNPSTDHVIEVGIVRIERLRVVSEYETLVRPGVPIPVWIRRLTGIDDAAVRNAPSFSDVAEEILAELADAVFVAHNVEFDYPFLYSHLQSEGYRPPPCPQLCTVRLARRFLPDADSHRLDALATHLGIPLKRHHRAVDDAMATAGILLRLISRVGSCGVDTLGELLETAEETLEDEDGTRETG